MSDTEKFVPYKPPAPVVVNLKTEAYDVYIGRGSLWGNPYRIGPDQDRETVIRKFEEYARRNKELMRDLYFLAGKRLGCYCSPAACHGDVIVKLYKEKFWVD